MQRQLRTLSRETTNEGCLSDATGKHNNATANVGVGADSQAVKKNAIEIKRERPVEEILYQDAKRRLQSLEQKQ